MDCLKISRRDGFQVIEMSWCAKNPGFRVSTFDEVTNALRESDLDEGIACNVFFGVPRCFCLGTDASSFSDDGDLDGLSESALRFFRSLINSKKPNIAAVDGAAIGLGMTMLFHFDAVFATPESTFKAPFVEWGLSPEAGSSILFPEALGYRKAFEVFCLGAQLCASEAERRGLVTRIVSSSELEKTALDAAKHIAKLPQRPLRATRDLMQHQRNRLVRRSRVENDVFQELLGDLKTQRKLRAMTRATRMALTDRKGEVASAAP
jgi:enoyl-CoA hydratase/carnithine racemase